MDTTTLLAGQPRGIDLKLARIAAGVAQRDVAAALGVSTQRASAIEATHRPTPAAARRYLAALDAITSGQRTSPR
jgi:transcriptional regulator with XRE-family HTH domain